jgi:hypothetical protein
MFTFLFPLCALFSSLPHFNLLVFSSSLLLFSSSLLLFFSSSLLLFFSSSLLPLFFPSPLSSSLSLLSLSLSLSSPLPPLSLSPSLLPSSFFLFSCQPSLQPLLPSLPLCFPFHFLISYKSLDMQRISNETLQQRERTPLENIQKRLNLPDNYQFMNGRYEGGQSREGKKERRKEGKKERKREEHHSIIDY